VRRALARVNLAAIERNVELLRGRLADGVELCAVVKADGYGHGAIASARAARAAGASWLAVATAGEAAELRGAGLRGPILVMGALSSDELPMALEAHADLAAWSERFVADVAAAAAVASTPVRMHVKLDTGLGRLGTRDADEGIRIATRISREPTLELVGAMTHFATADEDQSFVHAQLRRFDPFVAELRRRHGPLIAHAANSAATLLEPATHYDLVRCGIAIYGCDPMNDDPSDHGLEPALTLSSYVAAVKPAEAGDSAGYGRRFIAERDTYLATIPIGYGDGFRRAFTNNCDVLVDAGRYPLVGTVSMDNVTLDLGPEPRVSVGAQATIIGTDGSERQTAEDLARRIGTISYEVTCAISQRVPRVYHRDGEPVA
jgi:alanine racemase